VIVANSPGQICGIYTKGNISSDWGAAGRLVWHQTDRRFLRVYSYRSVAGNGEEVAKRDNRAEMPVPMSGDVRTLHFMIAKPSLGSGVPI
jgi:hypothetical protein